jgi:hypothetical protein
MKSFSPSDGHERKRRKGKERKKKKSCSKDILFMVILLAQWTVPGFF